MSNKTMEIENLNEQMGLALSIIPSITGTVSIFASASLIYFIFRENKQHRSREKLLLGLSFQCMLFSAACAMSTFTAPADMDPYTHYILRGNIATCNLQGFLYQFGSCSPIFNSFLCVYYLLILKYKRTDQELRKCVIPSMQFISFGWAFGSATSALALEFYNYGGILGCWIDDNHVQWCDQGIDLASCGRGRNYDIDTMGWFFGAVPILLSLLITIVATAVLYAEVKAQEVRARVRTSGREIEGQSVAIQPSIEMSSLHSASANMVRTLTVPVESIVEENEEDDETQSSSNNPPSQRTTSSGFFNRWNRDNRRAHSRMSRVVLDSGVLYVVAFWTTYTPFLVIGLCSAVGAYAPNWMRVLHVLLIPSQGLFNVIIYRMPSCFKKRRSSSAEGGELRRTRSARQRTRVFRPQEERVDLDRATNRDSSMFSSVQLPSTASMADDEAMKASVVQFDIPISEKEAMSDEDCADDGSESE